MRALVKAKPERGIWMERVRKPEVGHNDVLIKVKRTAVCGTDIHIYQWDDWASNTINVPMTVGHEFSGVVEEVGSEVAGFKPGDRVSGEGHITCGQCRNCRAGRRHLCAHTQGVGVNRPGAFAEYLVIPAMNAYHLPDDITGLDARDGVLDDHAAGRRSAEAHGRVQEQIGRRLPALDLGRAEDAALEAREQAGGAEGALHLVVLTARGDADRARDGREGVELSRQLPVAEGAAHHGLGEILAAIEALHDDPDPKLRRRVRTFFAQYRRTGRINVG